MIKDFDPQHFFKQQKLEQMMQIAYYLIWNLDFSPPMPNQ